MGRVTEEALRQVKDPMGIIVIFIVMIIAMPFILNFMSVYASNTIMQIRQEYIVAPLKGITLDFVPFLDLSEERVGENIITLFQQLFNKMPPPTESSVNKKEFQDCTLRNVGNKCTIDRAEITFQERPTNSIILTFFDTAISPEQQRITVPEDDVRFSSKYDLMFENTGNDEVRIIKGVPEIFNSIFQDLKSCYDAMYMKKEGDPLYKADNQNPYLCAKINLSINDPDTILTFNDLNRFIRTTVDVDTGLPYSAQFKDLQLRYCFDTDTCVRTKRYGDFGTTCFPAESLETGQKVITKQSMSDLDSILFGGVGGIFGWLLADSTNEQITCDLEKMREDFENTVISNKYAFVYYWDDNDDSYLGSGVGSNKIRAKQLASCYDAFLLSSIYYDYRDRQVDPLVICLKDL